MAHGFHYRETQRREQAIHHLRDEIEKLKAENRGLRELLAECRSTLSEGKPRRQALRLKLKNKLFAIALSPR